MIKKITILFLVIISAVVNSSCLRDQTEQVKEQEVIIKWMVFGEKYKSSDYVFQEFNRQLKKKFPDTKVEFEIISKENYREKWDMKMAGNETVDLAWMGTDIFNYSAEVKKGSLMGLNFILGSHGRDLLDAIDDEQWHQQTVDGDIYAIPVPGGMYQRPSAVVANRNQMERYGNIKEIGEINRAQPYTNIECYQSFEPFLENMKARNSLGSGVSYHTFVKIADKGYEGIYGGKSPFVIKIYEDRPQVYNKYELDSYYDCFATMAKWYQAGYIRQDISDMLNPDSYDGVTGGSILFIDEYGENGAAQEQIKTEYEEVRELLEEGLYMPYSGCRNSLVIPKSAEYPQRAMEIVNYLYTEEGTDLYRLLANGIEKEHYVILDGNQVARMSDEGQNYRYMLSPYTIGDVFQNYELTEGEFEQIRLYNQQAVRSKLLGFDLDTRMIAIEMAKVDIVVEQYLDTLCQGTAENWETLYAELIEKMKLAGSEKIILEMQRQIDEYLTSE